MHEQTREDVRRESRPSQWLMTVEQFVSVRGSTPLLEEMRVEWHRREASSNFPRRLSWADWHYQLNTYRNAKESGRLALL